jgi:tetratricopeptide (TPR) repeat protein
MSKYDWYQHKTWTEVDQAEFAAKLARCRTDYNKAQYLHTQASVLQMEGGEQNLLGALGLIEEILTKYAGDGFQLAVTYLTKGKCLEGLGRIEESIEMYRKSLQRQRDMPKMRTTTYAAFGELVVRLKMRDLYPEALAALQEHKSSVLVPSEKYAYYTIFAFIMDDLGRQSEAAESAELAMKAASQTESGMRYHKTLGVVTNPDKATQKRLISIIRKQKLFGWMRGSGK